MSALRCVARQHLKDWWVVAGFVRSLVWDSLHGYSDRTIPTDIDVVFFDPSMPASEDRVLEAALATDEPDYPWEVYNQAHMHTFNRHEPYRSSTDSISRWAETVSTVGVTLVEDEIIVSAPHGMDDLFNLVIRPTPHPQANRRVFTERLAAKNWQARWPNAVIEMD